MTTGRNLYAVYVYAVQEVMAQKASYWAQLLTASSLSNKPWNVPRTDTAHIVNPECSMHAAIKIVPDPQKLNNRKKSHQNKRHLQLERDRTAAAVVRADSHEAECASLHQKLQVPMLLMQGGILGLMTVSPLNSCCCLLPFKPHNLVTIQSICKACLALQAVSRTSCIHHVEQVC